MHYPNLDKSPDFVLLYGVNIDPKTCKIVIDYNDNVRKGLKWEVDLENNKFVMFPISLGISPVIPPVVKEARAR